MSNAPVILITGASSGIGEVTARVFAQEGYRVGLAARREERLRNLDDEIQKRGGESLVVQTDVTKLDQIENMVERTINRFGQIDVLFNNAGLGRLKWLEKMDLVKDIQFQVSVNLLGLIQTTRVVLPHMIQNKSGHIINMASIAGHIGTPMYSVYAATKFGVRGFTEALRREVEVHGIKVSGIYPGGVSTEFIDQTGIERRTGWTTPKALRLTSEEVALAVLRIVNERRRSMILPWPMKGAIWINQFFPRFVDWMIERGFTYRERR